MNTSNKTNRIIYIIGIVAFIVGSLDPMEGSVLIAAGSGLIALSTFLSKHPYQKKYLAAFILIVSGVVALFYLSSLGGFGGNSKLSWWHGLFILPYPIGWLITVVLLIAAAIKNKMQAHKSAQSL